MPQMREDAAGFSSDELIEELDREGGIQRLQLLHPVDLADLLEDLEPEERARILERLEPSYAADVVEAIAPPLRSTVAVEISDPAFNTMAPHLPDDVLTDLLQQMPEERRNRVMKALSPEDRDDVEQLHKFSAQTAGGLMTTNYIKVPDTFTTDQVWKTIQGAVDAETIQYIYVTDAAGSLIGVSTIRSILQQAPDTPLRSFMTTDVVSVPDSMDQEDVARVVGDYDISAVPVVDASRKLLGVITVDDVIDVIQQEASEDMYKMAGTGVDDPVFDPVFRRVRIRASWLVVTIMLGLMGAFLISKFGYVLEEVLFLAFFIPIIMALGGGVGIQASTIVIRGLATGQVTLQRGLRVVFAELKTGLVIGVVCGLITGAAAAVFLKSLAFGATVLLSMSASVLIAATWGAVLPLILHRWKIDPAVASGPLITSINDIISVLLYLGIASLLVL